LSNSPITPRVAQIAVLCPCCGTKHEVPESSGATFGRCRSCGAGVHVPRSADESGEVRSLRRKAAENDADALFNLGIAFETGDGVIKNVDEAMRWYRAAAAHHHAAAALRVLADKDNGTAVAGGHDGLRSPTGAADAEPTLDSLRATVAPRAQAPQANARSGSVHAAESSSAPNRTPATDIDCTIRTAWYGLKSVHYRCPNCNVRLESRIDEVGAREKCPHCHQFLVVPGRQELERLEREKQQRLEQRAAIAQEERESRLARKRRSSADRANPRVGLTAAVKGTKDCPFCGEEIQTTAKKCTHCGGELEAGDSRPRANAEGDASHLASTGGSGMGLVFVATLVGFALGVFITNVVATDSKGETPLGAIAQAFEVDRHVQDATQGVKGDPSGALPAAGTCCSGCVEMEMMLFAFYLAIGGAIGAGIFGGITRAMVGGRQQTK
jgi:hypothetical protein